MWYGISLASFGFIGLHFVSLDFIGRRLSSIKFSLYDTFRLSVGKETPP